jgi:hypothetical protein
MTGPKRVGDRKGQLAFALTDSLIFDTARELLTVKSRPPTHMALAANAIGISDS